MDLLYVNLGYSGNISATNKYPPVNHDSTIDVENHIFADHFPKPLNLFLFHIFAYVLVLGKFYAQSHPVDLWIIPEKSTARPYTSSASAGSAVNICQKLQYVGWCPVVEVLV